MPLVASTDNLPSKVEAAIEEIQRLPLSLLVRIIRTDEMFNLFRQQAADGRVPFRRENLRPAQCLAINADRDVLFGGGVVGSAHY
jgi:hypothetical protein